MSLYVHDFIFHSNNHHLQSFTSLLFLTVLSTSSHYTLCNPKLSQIQDVRGVEGADQQPTHQLGLSPLLHAHGRPKRYVRVLVRTCLCAYLRVFVRTFVSVCVFVEMSRVHHINRGEIFRQTGNILDQNIKTIDCFYTVIYKSIISYLYHILLYLYLLFYTHRGYPAHDHPQELRMHSLHHRQRHGRVQVIS
jgi:hypothetical protein